MRLEDCEEKIDFAAEACDLDPHTVTEVRRSIGMRRRLKTQFPESESALALLPTKTILELGKKTNAEFLGEALPILEEKLDKGVRPTKREVIEIIDAMKEEIKTKQNLISEATPTEPEPMSLVDNSPQQTGAKFNETNDNIEWAPFSWNPVTGCKHGCKYCYARDIANRFSGQPGWPQGFEPMFKPERLCAPTNMKLPQNGKPGYNNVFVCSMADLFGEWVPQKWIDAVMKSVRDSPDWNYLFLTKNPKRLPTITFPKNAWVGTTVDIQSRVKPAEDAFKQVKATVKFVSIEPMMEKIKFKNPELFDWMIIGGRSASTGMEAGQPEWEWVETLLNQARKHGIKVYFKPNLTVRPKEYPMVSV